MNTETADYVLTAFSPAMFGPKATAHVSAISIEEARKLVGDKTCLIANRATHEALGRATFPNLASHAGRYAELAPGRMAIHLHYRGGPIGNDGSICPGAVVTPYLIEVEEFQEALA